MKGHGEARLEDIIATPNGGHHGRRGNMVRCIDGFEMSVITGGGAYCLPRPDICLAPFSRELCGGLHRLPSEVACDYPGPFTHVEVGFPSQRPEPWEQWREWVDSLDPDEGDPSVYGSVPVEAVRALVALHGGEVPR